MGSRSNRENMAEEDAAKAKSAKSQVDTALDLNPNPTRDITVDTAAKRLRSRAQQIDAAEEDALK